MQKWLQHYSGQAVSRLACRACCKLVTVSDFVVQFGKIILTTSVGIMDHEEARRKKMGGKVSKYGISIPYLIPTLFSLPIKAIYQECALSVNLIFKSHVPNPAANLMMHAYCRYWDFSIDELDLLCNLCTLSWTSMHA